MLITLIFWLEIEMLARSVFYTLFISTFTVFVILLTLLHADRIHNLPLPKLFSSIKPDAPIARLHVLIVATSSNLDLCRLLLSLAVLSYPQPVLIDWEGEGIYNASETHLAKITGTLRYLDALPPEKQNDMILMLDGYDIFMQLGPDVLLKRYFQTTAAARVRLTDQFGEEFVKEHGLYDNVIFGPDKMCWPGDPRRAACWIVPESTLSTRTFGPDTDQFADPQLARPRWLNSGTIMGPVSGMRSLFAGTMDKINATFNASYELNSSDQLYFADQWADQEYMRLVAQYGDEAVPTPSAVPTTLPGIAVPTDLPCLMNEHVFVPVLANASTKDFHIGLDYESRIFQTCAFYETSLQWLTLNESSTSFASETPGNQQLELRKDILDSPGPFATLYKEENEKLSVTPWTGISLGVNVATGRVFPVLHFTGNKTLRDLWWTRMWFFPHAERLLRASDRVSMVEIGDEAIGGVRWRKDAPWSGYASDGVVGTGVWVDKGVGARLSWNDVCGEHESILFSGAIPSRPVEEEVVALTSSAALPICT